jgi:hypothetical protein
LLRKRPEVIIYGKTVQMSLLPKHPNNLERIQAIGQREGEAKEMQELWEEVHCQGERPMIHDDFCFNDFFCWEDPGLPLRNMEVIKGLRTLEKSTQERLAELEKDPGSNKYLIIEEKAILEITQREIRRFERQSLYSQLNPY